MSVKPLAVASAIATAISADSALAAWVAGAFNGASLTVKEGFYLLNQLRQEWFPGAAVVIGDEAREDNETLRVTAVVSVFVDQADFDAAEAQERVVTLARMIADIFEREPGRRLDGEATFVSVAGIKTDGGFALPKLIRSITLEVFYEG